jgi:UDP-N-acetylglucosamine transferase subunit ALG13
VIFVTVGHQMPFDRLIRAVEQWAKARHRGDIFAQIGSGNYRPQYFESVPFLTPDEFDRRLHEASAVVGHAGTGTIIAALQRSRPLLVLPRLSNLGETRNDHQIATARHFEENGHILAAQDEGDLIAKLDVVESFRPPVALDELASPELIDRVRRFVTDKA